MSSIKQKMFYISIVFIYTAESMAQSNWGYGLQSGMQNCNTGFQLSPGAKSYKDEYNEIKTQVKTINADISSKKSELRRAEADMRKMRFAMQRSLNTDAIDFVTLHSEEQRKCSDYEGMPKVAPRPVRERQDRDEYYEEDNSNGSETRAYRRRSRTESTDASSSTAAAGDRNYRRVKLSNEPVYTYDNDESSDNGGSLTGALRRSETSTSSTGGETQAAPVRSGAKKSNTNSDPSGSLVPEKKSSTSSTGGETQAAPIRKAKKQDEDSSMTGASPSMTGKGPKKRGPSSVAETRTNERREDRNENDRYDLPMDLTLSEFSRMCPAGRRELSGSAICSDEAMVIAYSNSSSKAECVSAVNNYGKKYAEVQSLTAYIEAQQGLLQTYSQQMNEVQASFTEEVNNQQAMQTEGGVCIDCMLSASEYSYEKQKPNWGSVLGNIGIGLAYTGLGLYQENKRQSYNASIGAASEWSPSPFMYGYPFFTAGIRGLSAGGGKGSFACGQTMGDIGGVSNSMWGTPAWANGGGSVGGSMYMPGMTPWGVNGPWGLSNNGLGVYPQIGGNFGGQLGFGNPGMNGGSCMQGFAGPICSTGYGNGGFGAGIPGSGINGGFFPGGIGPNGSFGAGINGGFGNGIPGFGGAGGQFGANGFNPFGSTTPFNTGGYNNGLNGGVFGNPGLYGGGSFGAPGQYGYGNGAGGFMNPSMMQGQLNQYNQYIQQQQQNLQYYNQYVQQQQQALAAEQQRQQALLGLQQEMQGFWSRYNSILNSGSTGGLIGNGYNPGINGGIQFGVGVGGVGGYGGSYYSPTGIPGAPIGVPSNLGTGASGSNR